MKKIRLNKRGYSNFFIIFSAILIIITTSCGNSHNTSYKVEVIPLEEGFGYVITKNHHIFIYQPFIPAVEGNYPFQYKEDARKVGNFIKQRLEKGEDLSVTEKDLLHLNLLSLKGY